MFPIMFLEEGIYPRLRNESFEWRDLQALYEDANTNISAHWFPKDIFILITVLYFQHFILEKVLKSHSEKSEFEVQTDLISVSINIEKFCRNLFACIIS